MYSESSDIYYKVHITKVEQISIFRLDIAFFSYDFIWRSCTNDFFYIKLKFEVMQRIVKFYIGMIKKNLALQRE